MTPCFTDGSILKDRGPLLNSNQNLDFVNGLKWDDPAVGLDPLIFEPEIIIEPHGNPVDPRQVEESHYPSNDPDTSYPVLTYITQMLMEENMEDEDWFFPDQFALQVTEKSLYDALGVKYPNLPYQTQPLDATWSVETSGDDLSASSGDNSSYDTTTVNSSSSNSPGPVPPSEEILQSNLNSSSQSDAYSAAVSSSVNHDDGLLGSSVEVKNKSSGCESDGVHEDGTFLASSPLVLTVEKNGSNPEAKKRMVKEGLGNKRNEREDLDYEEARASKLSALHVEEEEEDELSEMFLKMLLYNENGEPLCPSPNQTQTAASTKVQTSLQVSGSNSGNRRGKRQRNKSFIDFESPLILCSQAVSANNVRVANELLQQIRQNSSPSGDGWQRLAHYFANGLEARLVGSQGGNQNFYASLASRRISAADMLRAYKLYISSSPFKKFPICHLTFIISKLAEKAKIVHIIDFGIGYGFHWPILIQWLGERSGGAPKLRITGIELPQSGFRPREKVEETGRRLAKYCERFGVPFEYNAIVSQNWETISIEDLKIESDEMIAVNCLYRFKNLLDETVENSPRDAVLSLIRKIKPTVFFHAIDNGFYNTPFFLTRFREALLHFSSIYDMLDATVPRDNKERLVLEGEFYGRDGINVIACEGPQRVERPETYKQWHVRHVRAGLKQLPLSHEFMDNFRVKLRTQYHKDFILAEDGNWMLIGWKGRIMQASSCWVSV